MSIRTKGRNAEAMPNTLTVGDQSRLNVRNGKADTSRSHREHIECRNTHIS